VLALAREALSEEGGYVFFDWQGNGTLFALRINGHGLGCASQQVEDHEEVERKVKDKTRHDAPDDGIRVYNGGGQATGFVKRLPAYITNPKKVIIELKE
jgi:hypothetical protein